MVSTRVFSPYPERPTIIFSGAQKPDKIEALRIKQAEAAMVSFDFFKTPKRWATFHSTVVPCFDWPVRLYLDSGIYSLMRRAGVSRAKVHLEAKRDNDPRRFLSKDQARVTFEHLATVYLQYLREHHDTWNHIVELDVDQVFGQEVTLEWRQQLKAIVGEKLMPVWHQSCGWEAWEAMVAEFPYVGIGGDAGVGGGLRTQRHLAMYREMVDYAHKRGVAVQGFGDTKLTTFLATHWDSADSTTWITAAKYGQVGHLKASVKHSGAQSPQSSGKVRAWMLWAKDQGLDPDLILQAESSVDKLLCWVILFQGRQDKIRRIFQEQHIQVEEKQCQVS